MCIASNPIMSTQRTWSESERIHLIQLFETHKLSIPDISNIMNMSIRDITHMLVEMKEISDPNSVYTRFKNIQKNYARTNENTDPIEVLCEIISELKDRIETLEQALQK